MDGQRWQLLGTLSEDALLASLGVSKDAYTVTEEIALLALQAKRNQQISEQTLIRLLNGQTLQLRLLEILTQKRQSSKNSISIQGSAQNKCIQCHT